MGGGFAPWRDAAAPSHGVPFARTCKHSLFKTQLINWVGGTNRLR